MKYIRNKLLFSTNHIQCLIFLSILILQTSGAFATDDKRKIRWTAEILFASNKKYIELNGKSSYYEYFRKRKEVFLGIAVDFLRLHKKSCPWLSPSLVLSSGWFKNQVYEYKFSGGLPYYNYSFISKSKIDTFEFVSIPIIPQLGAQARPFYRNSRLKQFAINVRVGYQLNWIYQSNIKRKEAEYVQTSSNFWQVISYKEKTSYPSLKMYKPMPLYFYFGISNELYNKRLGYRISYSWQLLTQRGLECTLTYCIR